MVESYLDWFQAGVGCYLRGDVSTGSQVCPGLFGVDSSLYTCLCEVGFLLLWLV